MPKKLYTSLAIKESSKAILDNIATTNGLTQSEVIETFLDLVHSEDFVEAITAALKEKRALKLADRKALKDRKTNLRKLLNKLSDDDIEKILSERGLLDISGKNENYDYELLLENLMKEKCLIDAKKTKSASK